MIVMRLPWARNRAPCEQQRLHGLYTEFFTAVWRAIAPRSAQTRRARLVIRVAQERRSLWINL